MRNSALALRAVSEAEISSRAIEEIRTYFLTNAPGKTRDAISGETLLLGSDLLDSLGVLQLTMFLSDKFGVEIDDEDFTPENFATIDSLALLVERKQKRSP